MTAQSAKTSARTFWFAIHNLLRLRRNLTPLFFSTLLPVFFYLLFGTIMDFDDAPFKGGNFAALEMINMALYGGVAGSVSAAGSAVTDAKTGWARQLALTPLPPRQILWANLISIGFQALLPITAVYHRCHDTSCNATTPMGFSHDRLRPSFHSLWLLWLGVGHGFAHRQFCRNRLDLRCPLPLRR